MTDHDLVVVGAGIHGAGVAQAAAAAGYRVLVLEKSEIAAGTSSRSSKLIHGGLRYLETAQFGLVRESLRERRLLLELAPELVRLQAFHLPVYRETRRRAWQLRVGLSLYALLGGFARGTGFATVPRRDWHRLDGLSTDGLQSVIRYYDGQTDDRALTRAVMTSAESLGARLAMPAELLRARLRDDVVVVDYREEGHARSCSTRAVVNAAGPWAAGVAERCGVGAPPIELVQGTHLTLPGRLEHGIYYVESPRDGRAVFIMPRPGGLYVGTTETRYRGDPDAVHPLAAERHYLLSVLRHYFPAFDYADDDVLAATAGLRVLPAARGHAFHRPREALISVDRNERPRVLGIFGGKLTTYRAISGRIVRRLAASLPERRRRADTARLPLIPH